MSLSKGKLWAFFHTCHSCLGANGEVIFLLCFRGRILVMALSRWSKVKCYQINLWMLLRDFGYIVIPGISTYIVLCEVWNVSCYCLEPIHAVFSREALNNSTADSIHSNNLESVWPTVASEQKKPNSMLVSCLQLIPVLVEEIFLHTIWQLPYQIKFDYLLYLYIYICFKMKQKNDHNIT